MLEIIKTTYRNGAFVPQTPVEFSANEEVVIVVNKLEKKSVPNEQETNLTNEEKKRLLKIVVERMQSNSIPMDAPRFTREELHERR